MKKLILILFVLLAHYAWPCLNEYRVKLNGEVYYGEMRSRTPHPNKEAWDKSYVFKQLKQADSLYKLTNDLAYYSDFGCKLVYLGLYQRAKSVFIYIEGKAPYNYQVAANLGTTYELLGQNDSALYWIKEAIKINPYSHGGSEWIHVKILEAKVKAKGNNRQLRESNILGYDFGDDEIPENKNDVDLHKLSTHLRTQLNERMTFIRDPDPVVARLLFDLGNIATLVGDATDGFQNYKLAEQYGYTSEVFDKRYAYFKDLQSKADFMKEISEWLKEHVFSVLIVFGATGITYLIVFINFIGRIGRRRRTKV